MSKEEEAKTFSELDTKKQEKLLKAFVVFPANTTYFRDPTLDQFLVYTQKVKQLLGYSVDEIWNFYSRWSPVPEDLHALTTALVVDWPKSSYKFGF